MRALAVSQGSLLVAGYFSGVGGGVPAHSIGRWDGAQWHTVGAGIGSGTPCDYQYVFALAAYQETVFAAGSFFLAGGAPADRIARWNGSEWTTMGSGLSDSGYTLMWSGADLFAGGAFLHAGSTQSYRLARWLGQSAGIAPRVAPRALQLSVPSPFRPGQSILLATPWQGAVSLAIFDAAGRRIRTLKVDKPLRDRFQLSWDGYTESGRQARSGCYYLQARAGARRESRTLVLLR